MHTAIGNSGSPTGTTSAVAIENRENRMMC